MNGHGTNPWQQMVAEFHDAMELPVNDIPAIRSNELRAKLLLEEAAETAAALGFTVTTFVCYPGDEDRGSVDSIHIEGYPVPNLFDVVDGLCDTIYVAAGAAATMGVDLDPLFREVHRSNMAKVGGEVRADGKRLKPPGWTPPDIAGVLDDQIFCPIRSAITEVRCELPRGHEQYRPDRFHKFTFVNDWPTPDCPMDCEHDHMDELIRR